MWLGLRTLTVTSCGLDSWSLSLRWLEDALLMQHCRYGCGHFLHTQQNTEHTGMGLAASAHQGGVCWHPAAMTSGRAPQGKPDVPCLLRAMHMWFALCRRVLTSSGSTKRCSRRKLVDC